MRSILLTFPFWLLALQAPIPNSPDFLHQALTLVPLAGAFSSAGVAAFTLGRWRQKMHDLEVNVLADVARGREEATRVLARAEERLSAIERGQARIEATVVSIDARVGRLEQRGPREAA